MVEKYKEYNRNPWQRSMYVSQETKMIQRGYTLCYEEELPLGQRSGIRSYQKYVEQKFPDDDNIYVWYIHKNLKYFGVRTLRVFKKPLISRFVQNIEDITE